MMNSEWLGRSLFSRRGSTTRLGRSIRRLTSARVITLALLLFVSASPAFTNSTVATAYRGGLVSPPLPKPRFVLTDTSGTPFDFRALTQGYVTLLFFGYTHCPDMCPLQMRIIAQALKAVPPVSARQVKVVFVTTDPARDRPQVLRAYLDGFNSAFVGLTGRDADIEAAQRAANLPVAKKSAVRPDGTYDVGHAAFVIAYTKDNLAHVIYPVGMSLEDWVHDLPSLVNETWSNR
jgi:protein SCO1